MKNKPDPADSSLSETMVARIEIKELDDPVRQKEISDAVETRLEQAPVENVYRGNQS